MQIHTLYFHQPEYPRLLREIRYAPKVLYARGEVALLKSTCFAIVGTRIPKRYGEEMTRVFTQGMLSYGVTIVSGLAFGIDALAHEVTLQNKGRTIAVLGSGIDTINPKRHEGLARDILEKGGLILSEYPPGTPTHNYHFPARNRIISGLSLGTLVIEAPEKSGALITARRAFEQNRQVFAVPGDLLRETFVGSHALIANDIARLVRCPEEIALHLNLTANASPAAHW